MQINTITTTLQEWYKESKRDLPFRATKDPYKIWISEIMLQQTQIKTVIPYYNRWIETFPDIQTVANSKLDSLLKNLGRSWLLQALCKFSQCCKNSS